MQYPLKLLRNFWFCFGIQAIVLFAVFAWVGRLDLGFQADSEDYINASRLGSLGEFLNHQRTFAYPLFLKIVAIFSPNLALLPACQLAIHILAVALFVKALQIYGFSGWQALIAGSPLLYIEAIRVSVRFVLTDGLAVSAAVMTMAFLLMVLANRNNPYYWLGLLGLLFITYQIRPAYLFLIPLVPLLGCALEWYKRRQLHGRALVDLTIKLAGASTVPYLLFCLLRLVAVGDFGLVSFGGWVQTGITNSMLTADLVPSLPDDVQPLAMAIIEQRAKNKEIILAGDEDAFLDLVQSLQFQIKETNTVNDTADFRRDGVNCAAPLLGPRSFSLETWMKCMNYNCVTLGLGTAAKLYGEDLIVLNASLGRMSIAVITADPILFSKWLLKAFFLGSYREFIGSYGVWFKTPYDPLFFFLCLSIVVSDLILMTWLAIAKRFALWQTWFPIPIDEDGWFSLFGVMAIIGVPFYLSGFLLAILVQPPLMRFIWPVAIFFPSILSVVVAHRWNKHLANH